MSFFKSLLPTGTCVPFCDEVVEILLISEECLRLLGKG
jgi:hypothetical protein